MDFARFIQLIESQTLWFARVDQFEDPLEATHTDAELDQFRSIPPPPGLAGVSMLGQFQKASQAMRSTVYVNCWRSGKPESLAMWDLYGKGSGIVAVKSTIRRLKSQLMGCSAVVFLAKVRYIDWDIPAWTNNALVMCARKDSSYRHESEVRAMIWEMMPPNSVAFSNLTGIGIPWDKRTSVDPPFGLAVSVDVSKLITEIVVGPRERPWVAELVKQVLKRYSLNLKIRISDRLMPRR